jgi:hypothetical protein
MTAASNRSTTQTTASLSLRIATALIVQQRQN